MKNPDRTYFNPAKHLTEEQLMRYRREEMSDAEMHRLERHVLECALCNDALEGMELVEPAQATTALQDLKGRLGARVEQGENETPLYRKWAATAAVLLLVGAVYLLIDNFPLMDQERKNTTVEQESLEEEDSLISLQEEEKMVGVEELETLPVPIPPKPLPAQEKENKKSRPAELADRAGVSPPPASMPETEEEKTAVEPVSPEVLPEEPNENVLEEIVFEEPPLAQNELAREEQAESQKKDAPLRIRGMSSLRKAENEKGSVEESIDLDLEAEEEVVEPGFKELKGKVTDASGYPLPGVAIRVVNSRTGVTTNFDGEYSLQLPVTDTTLLISFVGFETKKVKVEDTTTQLIAMLEEDVAQLQEVVVTGAGREMAEISSPQPAEGMQFYKKYLKEQQRYPERAREAGVEGRVVVEFFVEPDGSLTHFTLQKSLGYGLDEEAIRLIKEGPKWKPSTSGGVPVRDRVKLRIRFRMD